MFALGIEFSLKELARVKAVALLGTVTQMALTMAAGIGLGAVLGWPLAQSLFVGGIIAISSSMVILKTLLDRGEVTSAHGRMLLDMLIVQDLAVVVLIVLLPQLAAVAGTALAGLALTLGKALAFIAATLLLREAHRLNFSASGARYDLRWASQSDQGTIPRSGLGSSSSIVRYSSRWPSGSRK
jgi:CPA2 family monovalent cation:H+ antiporter-2